MTCRDSRDSQAASAVPVIHWRGWRPLPLDLANGEQGGQVFLVLGREGDLALVPTATISYLCYAPLGQVDRWAEREVEPLRVAHSAAITRRAVLAAVNELTAEGWQVVGRLQATFHGVDTEDDFWELLDCGGDA